MKNNRTGSLLFLGTGSSTGVPAIGCSCKVCHSTNTRNKRLRTSALISIDSVKILIDASPDFRQQALKFSIGAPQALLLTHTHYDHVGGLEEFRAFSYFNDIAIPCYLSQDSFEGVQKIFYYHFLEKNDLKRNKTAELEFLVLNELSGEFVIKNIPVQYFSYTQGMAHVLGFRIGNMAYVTDIKEYSTDVIQALQGVDLLIVSAVCLKHSHVHMTIAEALAFVEKVHPQKTYFIHLSHDIEYEYVSSLLPEKIELAYDGLEITFNW